MDHSLYSSPSVGHIIQSVRDPARKHWQHRAFCFLRPALENLQVALHSEGRANTAAQAMDNTEIDSGFTGMDSVYGGMNGSMSMTSKGGGQTGGEKSEAAAEASAELLKVA